MAVKFTKPEINVREKLAELDKPSGIAGEAMLRAETPQEQFNLIGAGRRNLIINGAMNVAQRGTSSTFGQSNKGYKTVDRFQVWEQGTPTATFNLTQEADAPNGFKYSTKLACSTANTSGIPTSVHMYMQYNVETQDMYQLAWGTSEAKSATLSFWAKSNTAGTYVVSFKAHDGSDLDYYTAPYRLDGSGTWQYITIHIPANTITNIQSNPAANGTGLYILWPIQSSTTYSSGTPLTGWTESPSTSQLEAGQTADVGAAVGNYWQITGVQMETGKVATPFEHRSYGEELTLCERYYQRVPVYHESIVGQCWNTTSARFPVQLPVEMRTDPTITVPVPGTSGNSMKPLTASLSWPGGSGNNAVTTRSPRHFYVTCTGYSGLVAGNASTLYAGSNYIYIKCDAEL